MEGIKASQPGYDAKTASDIQLLFSSSWPLLKVIHEDDFIISSDTPQTIFTHNLVYPPAFFVCDASTGFSTSNPALNLAVGSNANELRYLSGVSLSFPITIHYQIYALDLTSNYTAPIVQQSLSAQGGVGDFGIKATKPGKDISSSDLRDFTIHSGTQSPMIHQIVSSVTQISALFAVVANHNLGYLPLFFPFVSTNGYYIFTGNYTQSVPRVFGNTSLVRIELGLNTPACLIIFKDPYVLDIPTTVISA